MTEKKNNRGFALVPIDDNFDYLYSNFIKLSDNDTNTVSCFVIMPFMQRNPQKAYLRHIKPFIQNELNMECIRIDEHASMSKTITEHIKEHILSCCFAIADISTDSIDNIIMRRIKEYKQHYSIIADTDSKQDIETADEVLKDIDKITETYFKKKVCINAYEQPIAINLIKESDSFYNANVYYEVGFAHAIGKPLILIKDTKLGKLPFDIKDYNVIVYDSRQIFKEDPKKDDDYNNELIKGLRDLLHVNNLIFTEKEKDLYDNSKSPIFGKWHGRYQLKGGVYDVKLKIKNDKKKKYDVSASITMSFKDKDDCVVHEYFRYNNELDKKSNPNWDYEGEWIEFIGTVWVKGNNKVLDYGLDVFAINKELTAKGELIIKIWDDSNTRKKEVLFERIS